MSRFVEIGPTCRDKVAIVVATIIAINAIGLFRENSSMLLGRSPGPEYLARIEQMARSVPGVLGADSGYCIIRGHR